ncbi:MAG: fibronectin type III domain-containing protein, partial [Clostridia bacterium]|nr:fibronectin type III domain-containing protein [Clostridia bacterium]
KLSATKFVYNGKQKTPKLIIKDSKGKELLNSVDYIYSMPKKRTEIGKYTVEVTFKGNYSGEKKLTFTIVPDVTSKITATQTTTTVTLKWSKVPKADGYRVYVYNTKTKKYEKLKDVTKTTLKISKLKAGTIYKYKVRAYTKTKADGTIWGDYSKVFETATKCKTPKITKLTTTKGKATVKWSNVSGESGYQVYYSTKKDSGYKKAASYKTNVVKGSKSKLKSGKKYYFKVRAYKTVDGKKIYSAWSAVKSVKVK